MTSGMAKGRRNEEKTAGTITSLSRRGSQGERVVVRLDGERGFDIDDAVAQEYGLRQGEYLDEARVAEVMEKDEPYRARDRALRLLARRDLCGSELSSKLLAAGISHIEVERVLVWLRERAYVDDFRYATNYVRDRTKAGWGRRRVMNELARKGLDTGVAKSAWVAWSEEHAGPAEEQVLVDLVRRRFGSRSASDPLSTRRRAGAFLARRGHDWELIARVLKEVDLDLGDTSDED